MPKARSDVVWETVEERLSAIGGQSTLQIEDMLAGIPLFQHLALINRRRTDPQTDTGIIEALPVKFFTRVLFAIWRYIRMCQNPFGGNIMAAENIKTSAESKALCATASWASKLSGTRS